MRDIGVPAGVFMPTERALLFHLPVPTRRVPKLHPGQTSGQHPVAPVVLTGPAMDFVSRG
jgi:hypothetical protein